VAGSVMQVLHQGGGAGSVASTLHLSLGLEQAGFHVRFVCPPDSEVERRARAGGLEVHPVSLAPGARRANAAKLEALLRRAPVDLVNSQSSRDRAALAWLALTRRLNVPLIVTRRQMPRTSVLENWLVSRMATRVVAVSRQVAEALRRRGTGRNKLVVIPNGLIVSRVDAPLTTAQIDEWRDRIGWEPSRPTLGIIARRKDQEVVIRALGRVSTPVRLVMVGLIPDTRLSRLLVRLPARHAVAMLPFTTELRPLYELLNLVLLPSRMEGLSQSLLEAMALGKPVVASAAGGNLDLIRDGVNGRLVPPRDRGAWARVIEELLSSPAGAERLGEAARYTAREEYTLERTVERTVRLYCSVLARS
ncbi:MAG TPA: glycosyltransferase family 4 protein, partial [Gemmatimonadales bacterium]|nr:glycosyltransferase family 4 protein [Gemmatimonadales bacterium]